ncbi:MAG: zinc-ribbon domain-containing protein [Candidatus Lokiarchaeota archaeon]|nr:zinc-ribbon domain-containing protein [Candidatus Lokiarchaeota archaeon]
MIFDEMHEEWGHMMDWLTPNGALIFLGVISFVIIVIILLFVLNRHTNREEYLEDATESISPSGKHKEFKSTETIKYCSECGSDLNDRNSKFCPLCGTKL